MAESLMSRHHRQPASALRAGWWSWQRCTRRGPHAVLVSHWQTHWHDAKPIADLSAPGVLAVDGGLRSDQLSTSARRAGAEFGDLSVAVMGILNG
jgi:hypothetical protein